jgi:hypothetical protein
MKYLKTFEIHHNDVRFWYYEVDDKGKDTGHRVQISYNEYVELVKDGLILIEHTEGGNLYRLRKRDREEIKNKLELLRSAKKYNL